MADVTHGVGWPGVLGSWMFLFLSTGRPLSSPPLSLDDTGRHHDPTFIV